MSKPSAVFSRAPLKNVPPSPVCNRANSSKTVTNYNSTPSPRKCRIQTEIQSTPNCGLKGSSVNVRSKLQFNCPISPKITQENRMTRPSPRSEQSKNEDKKDMKPSISKQKISTPTGVKVCTSSRENNGSASKQKLFDQAKSDFPDSINVNSMRSCFEHKEGRVPSRPPPSPSPSRAKSRLVDAQPVTPRNNNSIKGILSARSKYNSSPTFRIPSGNNTPTPRSDKLRRSVSASSISRPDSTPRDVNLTRCSSQTITSKHRVKFQDETTPECFSPVLLESKGDHGSGESIVGEVTNLTVAVRVRPPFQGERNVVSVEGNSLKVKAMGSEHCFTYEYCFDPTASQQCVFNTLVMPLVDVAFQGYNVCLFAYGQTGTGKTYSMMGEDISHYNITDTAGIIPRFSQELFKIIEGSEEYSHTKVEISYFEIYNEKIHDLLGPSQNGRSAPLRVREHPELGPYVVDLTVHNVHSFETLQDWLHVGNSHRETAATEINMNSSRSHSIFTVTLTQSQVDDRPSLCSKINLIDLAGSERLAHSCASGDRLKEGVSINRSLLTLGKVISSLSEKKKRGFIPYRESVLTWLLRESLGGNSRTAMLATISPCAQFVDETLSTLRYACQARNIVNTVRINESPHEKRIRELLEEIQRLKEGIEIQDHSECKRRQTHLQCQLDQVTEDLTSVNVLYSQSEAETEKHIIELNKIKQTNNHEECEMKVNQLLKDLDESSNWIVKYENEILDLKRSFFEANNKVESYQNQNLYLEQKIEFLNEKDQTENHQVQKLEEELEKLENNLDLYKKDNDRLLKDLEESKFKNMNQEKDIADMKTIMFDIERNSSHDHCDSQILMLQTALTEAERLNSTFKERIKELEKKSCRISKPANHSGCEKEINALKCTISELKKSSDHEKCESVIEKLKMALIEAEKLVIELENELTKLKDDNTILKQNNKQSEIKIAALKSSIKETENQNSHLECEERISTLKKALSVARSMNVHVQCENRIDELERELYNLQCTTTDHTKCDEKNNTLFIALEKFADENIKLRESHHEEGVQYKETIQNLENQVSKLTTAGSKNRKSLKSNQDFAQLETQARSIKEENSRIKKRRVDDEKKISSLEEQVISLTKELLNVKSQLRIISREKESSESLCAQLQEQLLQQDRKMAVTQSRKQLFGDEDKENENHWETPTKVIRRSIARYSNSKKPSERCSLVTKAEDIHQAVKDAEDICTRLKIPWVFCLEPEVTTHSWFDVNFRVFDQRTTNSVRWPQEVFLGWLRDMKEEIMSKSSGSKMFQSASWLQKTKRKELEYPSSELGHSKKSDSLQEQIEKVRSQLKELERLSESKEKQELMPAFSALMKSVSDMKIRLDPSSILKPSESNLRS